MIDKSEKYLKSIDNTLSDILKELKRQGLTKESRVSIDAKNVKAMDKASKNQTRSMTSEYL